jgi:TP901 family phage tail tape measure protein
MSTSEVRVLFLGNSASAVRSVRTLENSFGGLRKAAHLAGTAVAVGVVGGLTLATKAAIDFDLSMRQVNSIARLGEKQFQALSKSVLAMAKDTAQSPKTLADGLYEIVSSGFKAQDSLVILRASAKAATAGLTDTATATKAVVAVLNAYHLRAQAAGKVSDLLFQTVNRGVLTFEELASQIGDVLPIAAQLGVPLKDVGGALATITLHGVNAAEASTQLKQVLVSILKPSEELSNEIHRMGFETGEAALKTLGLEGFMRKLTEASHGSAKSFADWFPNVRAMNGALGITGKNIKTLHENIDSMSHSQGAAGKAFAEQSKSISVQWQKAKASLTAAAIPIGQLLFPALEKAAHKMEDFAVGIQAHMPEIRATFGDLSRLIGEVGTGLGRLAISPAGSSGIVGLLAALGTAKAAGGVENLVSGFRTMNPLVAALSLSMGALAASAFDVWRHFHQTDDTVRNLAASMHSLSAAVDQAKRADLDLAQARLNVDTTTRQLQAAEILYNRAVKESGRNSTDAKAALENVRQAKINARRATLDLTAAEKNDAAMKRTVTDETKGYAREIQDLAVRHKLLIRTQAEALSSSNETAIMYTRLRNKGMSNAEAIAEINKQLAKHSAAGFIADLMRLISQAKTAQEKVALLRAAIAALPNSKKITILIDQVGGARVGGLAGSLLAKPKRGRAAGGFIPGLFAGAPVPIVAHAGEVMVNPHASGAGIGASRASGSDGRGRVEVLLGRRRKQTRTPARVRRPRPVPVAA